MLALTTARIRLPSDAVRIVLASRALRRCRDYRDPYSYRALGLFSSVSAIGHSARVHRSRGAIFLRLLIRVDDLRKNHVARVLTTSDERADGRYTYRVEIDTVWGSWELGVFFFARCVFVEWKASRTRNGKTFLTSVMYAILL